MAEASVITRDMMFVALLAADPNFTDSWQSFLEEWEEEAEKPLYLALGELARYLIQQLECGETTYFDAIFGVVELWHIHGDLYVRQAASVGLLEGLQNSNLHRTTQPSDFKPWLRPESMRWWLKVERFWMFGEPLADF